jgi:hypothetical protein
LRKSLTHDPEFSLDSCAQHIIVEIYIQILAVGEGADAGGGIRYIPKICLKQNSTDLPSTQSGFLFPWNNRMNGIRLKSHGRQLFPRL